MSDSYTSQYADLAGRGINILGVDGDPKHPYYRIEYSWKDPRQDNKLHWSKLAVQQYSSRFYTEDIIDIVEAARRDLERGK